MALQSLRVLIVGGYGVFGGRLIQLLADEPGLTLIVAGRSRAKAEAYCRGVAGRAIVLPEVIDRDADIKGQVARLRPDVVVDAAGPFQAYGVDPYRVAEAALAAGADYLDLADAPDFVAGIDRLNSIAHDHGRFAISGASTCPALTAAVVRHLATGGSRVESIEAGIAPSARADMGLSVMRAIAGYAGRDLKIVCGGRSRHATALVDSRRHTISPPGVQALKERLFSLVDVPDLRLLPKQWPDLQSIWFGAGPAPVILHRAFVALAWLSHRGVLPSLAPAAQLLYRARKFLKWGEHRGGMFVVVEGVDANCDRIRREWSLIAEGDDGPFIPAMASAALILKRRDGLGPAAGARAATRELDYADFERFFATKRITAGQRTLD